MLAPLTQMDLGQGKKRQAQMVVLTPAAVRHNFSFELNGSQTKIVCFFSRIFFLSVTILAFVFQIT